VIDHGRFKASGLSRDLGPMNPETCASPARTAKRRQHAKIDLDLGHGPGARAHGQLEPGSSSPF